MDLAILGLAASTLYGYDRSKHSVFNILSWAGNSGDLNTATGRNTDVGMPNISPNWAGAGQAARHALIPPYPPPTKRPLHIDLPTHPSAASRLTKELRAYSTAEPFEKDVWPIYGGLSGQHWGNY